MINLIKRFFTKRQKCNHTYRLEVNLGGSHRKTSCPKCGYVFYESNGPLNSYMIDEQGRKLKRIG